MAGGKGKRLLPETETCPKPMLMVGGKPILEIIIQKAKIATNSSTNQIMNDDLCYNV